MICAQTLFNVRCGSRGVIKTSYCMCRGSCNVLETSSCVPWGSQAYLHLTMLVMTNTGKGNDRDQRGKHEHKGCECVSCMQFTLISFRYIFELLRYKIEIAHLF